MSKSKISTGAVDSMIHMRLAEEHRPVTAREFADYQRMVDFAFGSLQQQIWSMDITCGLVLESLRNEDGSLLTPEQREAFKKEVQTRVMALAAQMSAKAQEAQGKVQLV